MAADNIHKGDKFSYTEKNNLFPFFNGKTTRIKTKNNRTYKNPPKFPFLKLATRQNASAVGLKFFYLFLPGQVTFQIMNCKFPSVGRKVIAETNCTLFSWWVALIVSFFYVKRPDSDSKKRAMQLNQCLCQAVQTLLETVLAVITIRLHFLQCNGRFCDYCPAFGVIGKL